MPKGDGGQSTVEFALVLPFVLLLLLGIVQAGVLLRDQILVAGAAREAARQAAVDPDESRIAGAANRSAPGLELKLQIKRGQERGDPVTVVVSSRATGIPLVGGIVQRHPLRASATMRVERT